MFGWMKGRRRRAFVAAEFPDLWMGFLGANVPQYVRLGSLEQAKLRDDLRIFMAEKYWEGAGGLELSDEMKVTISAQACLLILCLDNDYYPNVQSVIVYPEGYRAPRRDHRPGGVVDERMEDRLGEAHGIGPVVLSWRSAREGVLNPHDGANVVFHEFAHKLDFVDGAADGVPRLYGKDQYDRWAEVMSAEFDKLVRASSLERETLLDPYGATNPAEFFAVCTECFFERPSELRQEHPRLYETLREYFRQDPAEWAD